MNKLADVDSYIAAFPEDTQHVLKDIRATLHKAVPEAKEAITYDIPTLKLNGKNMVHYGAFEHHIGFYATPDGHEEFEAELSSYKRGKGSVQFPLDKPMPLDLMRRIALFRAQQLTNT